MWPSLLYPVFLHCPPSTDARDTHDTRWMYVCVVQRTSCLRQIDKQAATETCSFIASAPRPVCLPACAHVKQQPEQMHSPKQTGNTHKMPHTPCCIPVCQSVSQSACDLCEGKLATDYHPSIRQFALRRPQKDDTLCAVQHSKLPHTHQADRREGRRADRLAREVVHTSLSLLPVCVCSRNLQQPMPRQSPYL